MQDGERMRLLPSMQLMHASGMCLGYFYKALGLLAARLHCFLTVVWQDDSSGRVSSAICQRP